MESVATTRALSIEPIFYVYVFFRLDAVPCYVGKGNGGRWAKHIKESHNKHLQRIFAKAKHDGFDLPVFIVRDGLIEAEAYRIESELIKEIGRADLGEGPLVNLTSGWEGFTGGRHTLESRAKISSASTGRKASPETKEKMSAWQIGRKMTDEAKANMSRAAKQKPPMSPETKAKIGAAAVFTNTGRTRSDETRAKISVIKKAEWDSKPEWRLEQSELAKERWANPTLRALMSSGSKGKKQPAELIERRAASNRGGKRSDETKARMSAAQKLRFSDPLERQKISDGRKNGKRLRK